MTELEGCTSNGSGWSEISKMKVQKAALKSAFTRARNKFIDAIQNYDIDLPTVKDAWKRVDNAQEAAQNLMITLSEASVEIND
ncbi:hypothetical protein HOLleu_10981 [Holothuria leucospilota]|uniref:Uncharacterized protein n=1 Tax=Holothuria leucospilota TaxID=206669 RepID=A0A9Q1CFK1_HOLLE|nr:hypothetical protein HOLleu_10981 [Holothuria leucospilota]